jgi:predicted Zn-dependent protease
MLDARPDARGGANFNFDFFAVRDPVLNAFAFPGGFIGFHSDLSCQRSLSRSSRR